MSTRIKLFLLLCLCGSVRVASQNLPYYDDRLFRFGFSLGTNIMYNNVVPTLVRQPDGNMYYTRTSGIMPGFSVGGIVDLRLARNINLRFTPTFHWGTQTISYGPKDTNAEVLKYELTSMPICLPLHLKLSANRVGNYRPYVLGGGGVSFNVARDQSKELLPKTLDCYVEFGVGCDTYFPFFKFAPELKFAIGLNDTHTPLVDHPGKENIADENKKYANAISKLFSRMITLTFNFE